MCIYCGTTKYRKIYQEHFGTIPNDDMGRTYEIHHIDGNHNNNKPENLTAISVYEHYRIHYDQGDFGACFLIGKKIGKTPENISAYFSQLAKKTATRLVSAGLHNFQGDRNPVHARIASGIQQEMSKNSNNTRVKDGTHQFLGGAIQRKRVEDGTHNFLGGKIQRQSMSNRHLHDTSLRLKLVEAMQKKAADGTHPFQTNNPNQIKISCPHCSKIGSRPAMIRWHFDNCKNI